MEDYFDILMQCPLFKGLDKEELRKALHCLTLGIRRYAKGETLFNAPSECYMGIVLDGAVHNLQFDYNGNQNIVASFYPSELFGESLVYANQENMPATIVAASDCAVLVLHSVTIIQPCTHNCLFHNAIIRNMVTILSNKNLILVKKIRHVTKRSIRDKVMSYLLEQRQLSVGNYFDIPYDRQQLADYLAVDRSALSNELSKLRNEGIIDYHKNHFIIFDDKLALSSPM